MNAFSARRIGLLATFAVSIISAPAHASFLSVLFGEHPVVEALRTESGIYNVRDFGAVGDGVTDDTDAWKSAVAAAHKRGGGIVQFPAGTYLITDGAVYITDGSDDQQLIIQGVGTASRILTRRTDGVFLQAGNFNQLIVRELTFLGDLQQEIDVLTLFHVQAGRQFILENCLFIGVRAADNSHLVYSRADDTIVRRCRFLGCAAAGTGTILHVDLGSLTVEDSAFFDFGNLGCAFYGKTSRGVGAWIYTDHAAPIDYPGSSSQNGFIVRRTRFDEGAQVAILLAPLTDARYDRVLIEDVVIYAMAVDGGRGIAIYTADNVQLNRVQVKDRAVGNRSIELVDAGDVEIRHSRISSLSPGAGMIYADSQTRSLTLDHTRYAALESGVIPIPVGGGAGNASPAPVAAPSGGEDSSRSDEAPAPAARARGRLL